MSTAPFTDHISDSVLLPKEERPVYCERCRHRCNTEDGMFDKYETDLFICNDCLTSEESACGSVQVARAVEEMAATVEKQERELALLRNVKRIREQSDIYRDTLLWIRSLPAPECPNAQTLVKVIGASMSALNGFRPMQVREYIDKEGIRR